MAERVEVLDPRRDPEPGYWATLRKRAGLHGDWDWPVLTAQAGEADAPQLITVLHGDSEPRAVVNASWTGSELDRRVRVGAMHVRAPGSSALPGWWLDEGMTARDLLTGYGRGMRRTLGIGCAGLILRQVRAADVVALGTRIRVVRPTEPVWTVHREPCADHEGWLRSLGKKRRSNLRVIGRQIDGDERLAIRVGVGAELDPARAAELLRLNDVKYAHTAHRERLGHLTALLRHPEVVTTTYTDTTTGRLLAIGTVLDHPEWPVWRDWSMVPIDDGGVKNLYFYHVSKLVEWALSSGKKGIVLGKGKAELKRSLGALPTEQSAVVAPIL